MHAPVTAHAKVSAEGVMVAALGWLARLPLLTATQLGGLLGRDEYTARALLAAAHGQGLVARVVVDSPEFPAALRLHYLTVAGVATWAHALGLAPAALTNRWPVSRAELLTRLVRVETAVGLADTLAMLATDLDRAAGSGGSGRPGGVAGAGVRLEDAGTAWWTPRRGQPARVPPGVEAWAHPRVGGSRARFGLAWDRAGAPRAHRRARVAAWHRADERRDAPWGATLPPVLMVCPDVDAVAQWHDLLDSGAVRRGRALLPVVCATLPDLVAHGPLGRVWRRPGGVPIPLQDLCLWEVAPVRPAGEMADGAADHAPSRQARPVGDGAPGPRLPAPHAAVGGLPGSGGMNTGWSDAAPAPHAVVDGSSGAVGRTARTAGRRPSGARGGGRRSERDPEDAARVGRAPSVAAGRASGDLPRPARPRGHPAAGRTRTPRAGAGGHDARI